MVYHSQQRQEPGLKHIRSTKTGLHKVYQDSAIADNVQFVRLTTFSNIWKGYQSRYQDYERKGGLLRKM